MTEPTFHCPDCGALLPADSPQSLCPACLMRQALASRTIIGDGNEAPIPPPLSPEEIGDKFPGFEVLECLGRGGMGVVYKARQKSLGRLVAIKILPPERVGEEKFSERFAIEAATLAKLSHPNIVTVHDFGEIDGLFYIVMEYIDGVNLRDLLREGKLEAKQALAIVPPICEALQFAHDKGIVHRDIKPENLLLDRDGRVKIADFGIASLMGAAGEIAGTPPYMAPEQKGANIDHRADIYALGVVLYEMLTGERPDKDLIAPSRKVQIDVRLDEMVLRALEKEPERRYQTAGEFRTVVETISETPPPLASLAADVPIRAGESLYATAEFLATTWGAMKLHEGTGMLVLYADRLVIGRGGQSTEIPFHAMRRLSVMSYPFWLSPMGRISILVEFEEAGKLRRIALTPTKGMFPFLGDSKPRVTAWFIAIREAITVANVQPPTGSETPEPYRDFSSDGLMWAKLSMICSPVVGLVALYLIFSGSSRNPGPVLLYMLFFIGGFFFVVRHRRNEWRRNNPLPKTADELAGKTPPVGARELSEVRSEIAAPAIAMAIVSGINLLGAVFGLLAFGLIALGLIPLLPAGIGTGPLQRSAVQWLGSLGLGGMTAVIVAIALGWMLLWIGAWGFTLVSALRMRRLQSRGWAIAGAIILIAAGLIGFAFANGPTPWITGVWSVTELGIGIWSLVELLRQDVREAFENAPQVPDTARGFDVIASSRSDARSQVAAPATGLMVASVLNLLLIAAALLLVMLYAGLKLTPSSETLSFAPPGMSISRTTSPPPQRPVWLLLLPVVAVIFIVIPSLLTFIGAWRMRGLRGYGLAITGAILGIITPPGLLIGLIFGIWALVVLSRREVREAFDAGTTRPVGKALLITGGVVAGIVLLGFLARFGLPMMHKAPKESFVVVSSESERAIPGQIKHMGLTGQVGSELFLDLETGKVFKRNGGSDRPRVDMLQATGIDLSVRFDPDKPRVTYWGCSLHGIGGGGPGLLIDGPAVRPDFVEPGWGKSLRQISNELPVPSADSSSSVEGALPLGVLVRTRNGPVALEISRYVAAPGGSPQLDLRYVMLPPPRDLQPQAQTVFDLHPVIELTIPMDKDGLTDMFDPESGQMIPTADPNGAPQGQTRTSRKGLLIKHDSQANQTELVGMNGVMTQESLADQWDEITNHQALDTLRKNYMSEGGSVGAVVRGKGPHTFMFKTESGKIGLLQVTGFTENPRGVKLRYKLVRSTDEKARKETLDVINATNDTNRFLDLELAVIDAKASGMGDKHPTVSLAAGVLARFKETHPNVPDVVWRSLVAQRLDKAKEDLLVLTKNGLGHAHPTVVVQQARVRALEELMEKPEMPEAPQVEAPKPEPAPPDGSNVITLSAQGEVSIAGMPCPPDQLDARLKELAANHFETVVIRPDAGALLKRVLELTEACKAAGLEAGLVNSPGLPNGDADLDNLTQPEAPLNQRDRIILEDLALHMIVAIREKDDTKLKSLAADRIKGWPESLPVFAVELREHYRQIIGDEKFEMKAGESLVDGDFGAVRCTGPAALEGKCIVMMFVKTEQGWKNQLLRAATENIALTELLADFRKQMEKAQPAEKPPGN